MGAGTEEDEVTDVLLIPTQILVPRHTSISDTRQICRYNTHDLVRKRYFDLKKMGELNWVCDTLFPELKISKL